ncbi:MAG: Trx7/PDZ domain-containing (seleno)protein [Pirellulales bacterium]
MPKNPSNRLGWNVFLGAVVLGCFVFATGQGQTREEKVRGDRLRFETDGFWIYNDFSKAVSLAKQNGKPILAVMRCVPCVECVKLDDELVESHPKLQQLLKQFVRVRLISTNGIDLNLFQFDTDQSFNVFLFNADGTIYGRYGTRSDREHWEDDVSVAGMAEALEGALELHAEYPKNREILQKKKGPAPLFASPEQFPTLKSKFGSSLDYSGNVVKSCIHCHQIGDAIKQYYWTTEQRLPEEVLFPYTHPKALGLIMDPDTRGTVRNVVPGSIAEKAGFQSGDKVLRMDQQPILSMADMQWVLHHTSAKGGKVACDILRGSQSQTMNLSLEEGWKAMDDIAWRVSSWELRRLALGGLFLKPLNDEEVKGAGLSSDTKAFRVQHVGQFAPHDGAKKAGFLKDDIVTKIDGRVDFTRETDVLAHVLKTHRPGDTMEVQLSRNGQKQILKLTVPPLNETK